MNIEKKKKKFFKRLAKACAGDVVKVIKLKRKHFKDSLSTDVGFGWQDLKSDTKEFYGWLITEGIEFKTEPIKTNPDDFSVLITTIKTVVSPY